MMSRIHDEPINLNQIQQMRTIDNFLVDAIVIAIAELRMQLQAIFGSELEGHRYFAQSHDQMI